MFIAYHRVNQRGLNVSQGRDLLACLGVNFFKVLRNVLSLYLKAADKFRGISGIVFIKNVLICLDRLGWGHWMSLVGTPEAWAINPCYVQPIKNEWHI